MQSSREDHKDTVLARQALALMKEKAAVLFLLRLKKAVLSRQDSLSEMKASLSNMLRNRSFALIDGVAGHASTPMSVELDVDTHLNEDTVRTLLQ